MKLERHGVSASQELSRSVVTRKKDSKLSDFFSLFSGRKLGILMMLIGVITLSFPSYAKFLFFYLFFLRFIGKPELLSLPLYMPGHSKQTIDPYNIKPGPNGRRAAKPEANMYLGNCMETGLEVWQTATQAGRHLLYAGTTGAGKTVGLTTITVAQGLMHGSGYSYTDGKAQLDVSWTHLSNAFRFNRALDFLMLNYITGGKDHWGYAEGTRASFDDEHMMSNTFNPHRNASYSDISELHISLLDGDNDIWAKRCETFSSALTKPLVYLRDQGEIQLSVESYIPYLSLEQLGLLAGRTDIPDTAISQLREFIKTLPGVTKASYESLLAGKPIQSTTVYDQFGYVTMQLIPLLNMLIGDYGFIFRCLQGQINMRDVVINRRILLILLPALEKSPSNLANLGRITLAAQKSMMGGALGNRFEGDSKRNFETSSTSALVAFLSMNDEIGYYFVPGTSVTAAQTRSLFIQMIYATQDFPAMRRMGETASIETDSVIGNTITKYYGLIKDEETFEQLQKDAGDAFVLELDRIDLEDGIYQKEQSLSVQKRNRIERRDLNDLVEGEVYINHRDKVFPMSIPQLAVKNVKKISLNDFLPCPPLSTVEIKGIDESSEKIKKRALSIIDGNVPNISVSVSEVDTYDYLADSISTGKDIGIPTTEAAIGSIYSYLNHLNQWLSAVLPQKQTDNLTDTNEAQTPIEDDGFDIDNQFESNDNDDSISLSSFEVSPSPTMTPHNQSSVTSDNCTQKANIDDDTHINITSREINEIESDLKPKFEAIFSSIGITKDALVDNLDDINKKIKPNISDNVSKAGATDVANRISDNSGYPGPKRPEKNIGRQKDILKRLLKDINSD